MNLLPEFWRVTHEETIQNYYTNTVILPAYDTVRIVQKEPASNNHDAVAIEGYLRQVGPVAARRVPVSKNLFLEEGEQ